MMLVPWPVVEACGDVPHRLVFGAGVVLGDHDHQARSAPRPTSGAPQQVQRRSARRSAAAMPPIIQLVIG